MRDEDFNPDAVFDQLLNGFSEILNSHAPIRPQTRNEIRLKTKPWTNNGILKYIKKKMLFLSYVTRKTT